MKNPGRIFVKLAFAVSLLTACASEQYTALGGGYGYVYTGSNMPHSAWNVRLVYDGPKGRKLVWENLMAGYGGSIIHDSLVVFIGGMRSKEDWLSSDPFIFIALEGGPPVEVTQYMSTIATGKLPGPIGGQLVLSEYTRDNDNGVSFSFITNLPSEESQVAPIWLKYTWEDLATLVKNSRSKGKRASYGGVTYFRPTIK